MSGVYIPSMEIPVGHNEATFGIDADGYSLLAVYTEKNPESEIYYIVPVPDHGRLIDADVLVKENTMAWGTEDIIRIAKAPIIIPADKEVRNEDHRLQQGIE